MKPNMNQDHFTSRVQFGNFHSVTDPFASDADKAAGRVWTLPGTKTRFTQAQIEDIADRNGYKDIF
jgi:hypothetical protein